MFPPDAGQRLGAAELVLNADDVVFPEIRAGLHLDELEVYLIDDLDTLDDEVDHDEELSADRPPHYDQD